MKCAGKLTFIDDLMVIGSSYNLMTGTGDIFIGFTTVLLENYLISDNKLSYFARSLGFVL